jgi:hypothetical protein
MGEGQAAQGQGQAMSASTFGAPADRASAMATVRSSGPAARRSTIGRWCSALSV